MAFPHKNIRLQPARYRGIRWHFITLCCADRNPVFANAERAIRMVNRLRQFTIVHRFAVHAYSVMPDHAHALIAGLSETSDLLAFVKNLKGKTTYEFHKRFHRDLWQKKFYDHILRENDGVARVAYYIWMNPVRASLCQNPQEYPFSGSFVLDWKKETPPRESWAPPWKDKAPAFPT